MIVDSKKINVTVSIGVYNYLKDDKYFNKHIKLADEALYLAKLLSKKNINTSRIANGLPIGSNIDYADELTLLKSLEGRKKI